MERPEQVEQIELPVDDRHDSGFRYPPDLPDRCKHGHEFRLWVDAVCDDVEANSYEWSVNKAILLLTHKYFEWYVTVPKQCRYKVSDIGHECIWHAFQYGYYRLRKIGLAITPPSFELPPPKPEPPAVRSIIVAEND